MNGTPEIKPGRYPRWEVISPVITALLSGIYPVLSLYAHNAFELTSAQVWLPLVFSLALSLMIFCFWVILLKNATRAALATILLLVLFWNYSLFYDGICRIVPLKHYHFIPIVFAVHLHLVWAVSRIRKKSTLSGINTVILIPMLLLFLFNGGKAGYAGYVKYGMSHRKSGQELSARSSAGQNYPDIYLIIFDEYAGIRTVKEEWGYDNSGLAGYLKERGFFFAGNSEVRYSQTEWNLASLLNLNYLTGPVDKDFFIDYIYNKDKLAKHDPYKTLDRISWNERIRLLNNNFLATFLRQHGYKIVFLGGTDLFYQTFNTSKNADYVYSYRDNNPSIESAIILNPFYLELIRKSMMSPFYMFIRVDRTKNFYYTGTKYIFNYLNNPDPKIKSPRFVYAHIMCPHTPYVFDRYGNYSTTYQNDDTQRGGRIAQSRGPSNVAYLEQYLYVSSEIRRIAGHVPDRFNENSVFILQSDHGCRPHTLYLKNRCQPFRVFNAVYFPDRDYSRLYGNISPVNTVRVVLNKYFGEHYPMLEDR